MESRKAVLLITGITGYIGSQVGLIFLQNREAEGYQIRASVRSLKNKDKLEPLRKAYGEEAYNQIDFVEADLTNS